MLELNEKDVEQVVGGTDIPTFEDPIKYLDPVYYEYTPVTSSILQSYITITDPAISCELHPDELK